MEAPNPEARLQIPPTANMTRPRSGSTPSKSSSPVSAADIAGPPQASAHSALAAAVASANPEIPPRPKKQEVTLPSNAEVYEALGSDTLAGIAVKFNMTVASIRALNKLWSNSVYPGQKLYVRSKDAVDLPPTVITKSPVPVCISPPVSPRLKPLESVHPPIPPIDTRPLRSASINTPPVIASTKSVTPTPVPTEPVADDWSLPPDVVIVDDHSIKESVFLKSPSGNIAGIIRVSSDSIVFSPENQESFHPVSIAMDGVKSCKITIDPSLRPTSAESVVPSGAPVILRLEVKEPSWMMWKASPLRIYEFVVPQDSFRNVHDPIVEFASLEHLSTLPPSNWASGWFSSSRRVASDASNAVLNNLRRMGGRATSPSPGEFESTNADGTKAEGEADKDGSAVASPTEAPKSPTGESRLGKVLHALRHDPRSPPPHVPTLNATSRTLTQAHIEVLVGFLPGRLSLANWTLIYSTGVHGISMNTMYSNVFNYGAPAIFVIKDLEGHVFGAFASDCLRMSPHFYGTGETFVFRLDPDVGVFTWSRRNDFFMYGGTRSFSFGGGSNFALWIDEDLLHGNSQFCETFDSPTLSSSPDFEIAVLEVWGFDVATHKN